VKRNEDVPESWETKGKKEKLSCADHDNLRTSNSNPGVNFQDLALQLWNHAKITHVPRLIPLAPKKVPKKRDEKKK